jgi:hypothetical protein
MPVSTNNCRSRWDLMTNIFISLTFNTKFCNFLRSFHWSKKSAEQYFVETGRSSYSLWSTHDCEYVLRSRQIQTGIKLLIVSQALAYKVELLWKLSAELLSVTSEVAVFPVTCKTFFHILDHFTGSLASWPSIESKGIISFVNLMAAFD